MTRLRFHRAVAAAASALLLAVSALGASSAIAAQPAGWDLSITKLPAAVSPGAVAGYRVFIENTGPSNISQLYLTDSVLAETAYLTSTRAGCTGSPVLFCSFGALNVGDSITVTVAYLTPDEAGINSFSVTFQLNTTGKTFSDVGRNSHGDTKEKTATTALVDNENFDGGFVQSTDSIVGNGSSLSRRNIQSTQAIVDASATSGIPVTVEDGTGITFACINCTGTQFGEWSDVQVAEGSDVSGLIHITITVYWKYVPNHINLNNLVVFHTYTALAGDPPVLTTFTDAINTPCGATPTANCLTPTLLESGNLQIDVYVLHNGGFKPGVS